jgi:uncharacterized RDD family membrane protein YckC
MIRGMSEGRPAGFWLRALALALDFAIFLIVRTSYRVLARAVPGAPGDDWTHGPLLSLFTLLFAAAYTIVLHALFGQTLGKLVVGVRVVAGDGPPPLGVSLLRFCAYFASVASFGVGYLMAALRRDKRALHDLIAGTCVERMPKAHESAASAPAGPPGGAAAV